MSEKNTCRICGPEWSVCPAAFDHGQMERIEDLEAQVSSLRSSLAEKEREVADLIQQHGRFMEAVKLAQEIGDGLYSAQSEILKQAESARDAAVNALAQERLHRKLRAELQVERDAALKGQQDALEMVGKMREALRGEIEDWETFEKCIKSGGKYQSHDESYGCDDDGGCFWIGETVAARVKTLNAALSLHPDPGGAEEKKP